MPISSSFFSAVSPVKFLGDRSNQTKWLSVPPVTTLKPLWTNTSANIFAFDITDFIYAWNSGFSASPKDTALAAITCIKGPPCKPGKTAELIFLIISSLLVRIIPLRAPLNVLWVVEVTISAYSMGFGYSLPATNPE